MYNFKKLFTYMVVGALVMALSISCKNDEKTGSGDIIGETNQNHPPQGIYSNGYYNSYAGVTNNGSYCSIIGKAYYSEQVSVNSDITVMNWYQEYGNTSSYAGSSSRDGEATINSPTTDYFQVSYDAGNGLLRVDIRTNANEIYTTSYLSKQ
ncbi:hypothetical protein EPJ64_11675 [Brachyspira aalborgi]|uniref:Lipocalin-like domain-containing protein n=3 Tax=Brachyspira TaxID=29521 RepID=A0AB38PZS4_9SPIR|nr:hypothetical protein [Brachyspira aalborgi]TXJ14821.1 hypothetical protein EPJ77_06550 [Brachyspira aalborgi]TXJ18544.1 hypothetical protein EPJ64_11675 [Brachyspira aalborgi]TXJ24498.1 hypothetical protein EPJ73_11760 [Brachyspira aalborgi]TXJ48478.1 hypothetical protein EPJ75_06530 [Brachyspira aalborgi]